MGMSAYTLLTTVAGDLKRAEDIVAGDELKEALTGQTMVVVTTLNSPGVGMVRVTAEDDTLLDVTGDQNLLTDSGMLAANRLVPGTWLRTAAGFVKCLRVEPLMGDYMVYDLEVESEPDLTPWALANGLVASVRD